MVMRSTILYIKYSMRIDESCRITFLIVFRTPRWTVTLGPVSIARTSCERNSQGRYSSKVQFSRGFFFSPFEDHRRSSLKVVAFPSRTLEGRQVRNRCIKYTLTLNTTFPMGITIWRIAQALETLPVPETWYVYIVEDCKFAENCRLSIPSRLT